MPDDPLPPAVLERVGAACFGALWQRPMAAALPVNYRTLQRWTGGTYPPAPWVLDALFDLVEAEAAAEAARLRTRRAQVEARDAVADLVKASAARLADLESLRGYLAKGDFSG